MNTVEQLALYLHGRDSHSNGLWPDGLVHPTWDEIGEPGREAYLADADAIVKAMRVLGWRPAVAATGEVRHVGLNAVLDAFRDGDEHGWSTEFGWLRENHAAELAELEADVRAHGILTPVLLGSDGKVWDGHHRLCVATTIGLPVVPVLFVTIATDEQMEAVR